MRERDGGHCLRCGGRASLEVHHRRRRGVRGDDPHALCNLVSLCRVCHTWAHGNPAHAREQGFIVSSYTGSPSWVPVETYSGLVLLSCDGGLDFVVV